MAPLPSSGTAFIDALRYGSAEFDYNEHKEFDFSPYTAPAYENISALLRNSLLRYTRVDHGALATAFYKAPGIGLFSCFFLVLFLAHLFGFVWQRRQQRAKEAGCKWLSDVNASQIYAEDFFKHNQEIIPLDHFMRRDEPSEELPWVEHIEYA